MAARARAIQQDVAGVVQEAQRGELADELLVHPGLGGEVEVGERVGSREGGDAQQPGVPAGGRGGDLGGEQPLQGGDEGEVLGAGGIQDLGERLGRGGQSEGGQVGAQPLVGGGLGAGRRLERVDPARGAVLGGVYRSPASSPAWPRSGRAART